MGPVKICGQLCSLFSEKPLISQVTAKTVELQGRQKSSSPWGTGEGAQTQALQLCTRQQSKAAGASSMQDTHSLKRVPAGASTSTGKGGLRALLTHSLLGPGWPWPSSTLKLLSFPDCLKVPRNPESTFQPLLSRRSHLPDVRSLSSVNTLGL